MSSNNKESNKSSSWVDRFFNWLDNIELSPSTIEWMEEYNKASDNFGNGYIGGNFGGF
jgi:hypothetical protein